MSCHTLIEELRKQGYRLTPQREMIVEAVAHAGRHVTAEEVYERVCTRTSAVNVATVYLGDGRVTYASPNHGPHCHLVCRRCGQVIEADYELVAPLKRHLQDQYRFMADLDHLAIPGLCANCETQLSQSAEKE
jgi:Fur family ferric uptake transcriptional regulator